MYLILWVGIPNSAASLLLLYGYLYLQCNCGMAVLLSTSRSCGLDVARVSSLLKLYTGSLLGALWLVGL